MSIVPWKEKREDSFNNFLELDDMFKRLNIFSSINRTLAEAGNVWYPSIDVSDDDKNVYVRADLPGVNKEDIGLSIENDVLTIKGKRKNEEEKKGKNYHIIERGYGSFQRSIALGVNVDEEKINAKYKEGVLEIFLPKEEREQAKKINIDLE